jgi:CRP/FNR family cyclic AMP-dependent transcriptional regulator
MISPETLKRYPCFAGLDDAFIEQLAMITDEITLSSGVWLFHEGDTADAFYVIERGTVQLQMRLPRSRHADLDLLVEGEMAGWSSICAPGFYTLSAFTPDGATVLRVDSSAAFALMQERPEMGFALMRQVAATIGKRLNDLRNRFVSVISV